MNVCNDRGTFHRGALHMHLIRQKTPASHNASPRGMLQTEETPASLV